MALLTFLFFIVLALGFGYSITFFIKWEAAWYEKFFVMLGLGLGVVPVIGIILNHLRIQIFWPVFLALSLIVPVYRLIKTGPSNVLSNISLPKFALKKSDLYFIAALVLCIAFFVVYHTGAFRYPYLEDDDPWLHAQGVKYVKEMRTISFTPEQISYIGQQYLEPYPPGYDILMGILHQTNDDVIWTLKFFNVLILSIIGVLFYFFAVTFLGSRKKALLATFFIIIIPCFMSHFIWASSLAVMLFFPSLYAVERIQADKRWFVPAAVCMAGMIMTQMSNPFIFGGLLLIYIMIKSISDRKVLWGVLFAGFIAAVVAFSLFWIPTVVKFGLEQTAGANSININDISSITTAASGGGLLYSWSDFIIAQKQSKMDNPIGIGVFMFFILVFSLLYIISIWVRRPKSIFAKEESWKLISVVWLLIAFMGIHGNRMPFPMLMPHRWWAIFAIPVALICVEGFFALGDFFHRIKVHRVFIYAILLIGILITSAYPKYVVETSYWPPGANWGSMDEVGGYISSLSPLPYNTKVFPLCSYDWKVLAFDKFAEPWDTSYAGYKQTAFNESAKQLNIWLKSRGYNYLILDSFCVRKYGLNETNNKLAEIGDNSYFSYVSGNNAVFMFRTI